MFYLKKIGNLEMTKYEVSINISIDVSFNKQRLG